MNVRLAELSDAAVIHQIMMKAYDEYRNQSVSSSALEETVDSILNEMNRGEKSFICKIGNQPVGIIRFKAEDKEMSFHRLSVVPDKQGRGVAKFLLEMLEKYAECEGIHLIKCKVRMNVSRNIKLYQSMGYKIYDKDIVYKPNDKMVHIVLMCKALGKI